MEKHETDKNGSGLAVDSVSAGSTLSGDEAFAVAWEAFKKLGKLGGCEGEMVTFSFDNWDDFADSMNEARKKLNKHHETFLP